MTDLTAQSWPLGETHRLRRAQPGDVAAIVALLRDDMLGATRESGDLEAYRKAFQAIDADPHQFLAVVTAAELDEVVATCQLTFTTTLSRGGATRMTIEAVRVSSRARESGLGSLLIRWTLGYGRDRGATIAQLTTDRVRVDAHRFYARLGFIDSHLGLKLDL